jgi:oligopeptidase A
MTLQLPAFSYELSAVEGQLQTLLRDNLEILDSQNLDNPIQVQQALENRLQLFWSPIAHLHAVNSTPALRKVYQACLPLLSDYSTAVAHHKKLYDAVRQYQPNNPAEKRIIEIMLRDFHLAGVDLPPEKKVRYGEIEKSLSELSARFSENVLDATQAWSYTASDEELEGIPVHLLPKDKKLGLDYPCYSAILRYAENRALREKCYTAYVTRASDKQSPDHDNTEIMQKILTLRHELAELLGFKQYAELSLQTKMANSADQVLNFLNQLVTYAKPAAEKELHALTEFAGHTLAPWDTLFYAEKLSRQRYHIHQELFRPYFPTEHVLSGLFSLVSQLYGISIRRRENVETWSEKVSCFEIYTKADQLQGIFYVDVYTRPFKREGAWMDEYCSRYLTPEGKQQIPVAYLTCNFMPPQDDLPGLLTHDDVITLFHEFGHGLQHLLTQIDYIDISGIHGVPWDAVELPSQFMENFCWDKTILKSLSQHYETKESLPDDLINKLLASRHFNAGLQLLRQLEFGLFDFHLHLGKPEEKNRAIHIYREIHQKIGVMPLPEYARFPHTFSHIFSGGYAAAYYSYLWAEVLSSDVFSLFEEKGVIDAATGQKFLDVFLSQGGAQPPEILFKNFRGREPNQTAFLKSWGLAD